MLARLEDEAQATVGAKAAASPLELLAAGPAGQLQPRVGPGDRRLVCRRTADDPRQPRHKWLAAHAADKGLINLPSERWHWSVTGR